MSGRQARAGVKGGSRPGCLVMLVVAAMAGAVLVAGVQRLPAGYKPWVALTPDEVPGPATRWKLAALADDPAACRAFLAAADLSWSDVPDRREGSFCAIEDTVRLAPGSLGLAPNVPILRCPVAAGLVLWRRHGLEPLARQTMGSPLRSIEHIGSYNCRLQRGNAGVLPSQHATANAVDITGFTFADGSRARLPDDWTGDGRTARFVRQAQTQACQVFKVVLGPKANAAHADHFHLDMGPFLSCR
jgi:hypothetical protein